MSSTAIGNVLTTLLQLVLSEHMNTEDLLRVSAVRRLVASGEVRERREALHLSAREMAAAIQSSPAAVCRWESGQSMPKPAAALRLAKLLGITPVEREAA